MSSESEQIAGRKAKLAELRGEPTEVVELTEHDKQTEVLKTEPAEAPADADSSLSPDKDQPLAGEGAVAA